MFKNLVWFTTILFLICEAGFTILPSRRIGNQKIRYCDYDGLQIEFGKTVSVPGKCMLAACHGESITASICVNYDPPPGCHETEINYDKPYPECCPQSFCD